MMTKRSNHIPMLIRIETTNITGMLVRNFLNQKTCGLRTLQEIIVQYAQAYGPPARFLNTNHSYSFAPYQAMKNSMAYA